jgi:hypothetical protein
LIFHLKKGSHDISRVHLCCCRWYLLYRPGAIRSSDSPWAHRSAPGISAILLSTLFARVPIPGSDKIASAPWWAWLGGVFGIAYGLAVVFLGRRMGAATMIATVVTGQLICSVVVDHFAWVGPSMTYKPRYMLTWRVSEGTDRPATQWRQLPGPRRTRIARNQVIYARVPRAEFCAIDLDFDDESMALPTLRRTVSLS